MKFDDGDDEKSGLTGSQWRVLAWVVVFIIGFIMMLVELNGFYSS